MTNQSGLARAFWVVAPGRGGLRVETLGRADTGEALVRALYSGVSRGTEALVFAGKVPASEQPQELAANLPEAVSKQVEPGDHADFVVYATQNVEVTALVVVPLQDELPPPPPEPWTPRER